MEPYAAEREPTHRRRRVPVLGALIVLVLTAGVTAALLDDGDGPTEEVAVETLLPAADTLTAARTVHLRMSFRVEGGGMDVELSGKGAVDNEAGVGSFHLDLPCGQASFVSTGEVVYVRGPAAPGWTRIDMSAVQLPGGGVQGAPVDPQQMLDSLRDAGNVERVGAEELDGIATIHYRARLKPDALLSDADAGALALLTEDGVEAEVVMDVWTDEAGLARRLETGVEAKGVAFAFRIDLTRFGEPVEVSVPAEDSIVAHEAVTSMADLTLIGSRMGAACVAAPSG